VLSEQAMLLLCDLVAAQREMDDQARVDPFLLIQAGPSYGLKPGPKSLRTPLHPGLIDALEDERLVRHAGPTNAARKFRLTADGRTVGEEFLNRGGSG
jgi:hypothetical protein